MTQFDYPLQFNPIYIEKIWGGQRLNQILHKNSPFEKTGESWEISTVDGHESIVTNGKFKEKTLKELCATFPNEILGKKIALKFNNEFPLLIKFLDAHVPLSVQVHPDDDLARGYNSLGKNEMWVIMEGSENGTIYLGFEENESLHSIENALNTGNILDKIKSYSPKKYDAFDVKAGTIHAIGNDVLLAEIQQTSDITFRLYDFERVDENGNSRDLHIQEALKALNYSTTKDAYLPYNQRNNEVILHNAYFKVNQKYLDSKFLGNTRNFDSFVIYMILEGNVKIETASSNVRLTKGETVLLPYALGNFNLMTEKAEVLEIYV